MFTVEKQIEIDAGHRVPFHEAGCRHLHGHRWKIVAVVEAEDVLPAEEGAPDSGMVIDFGVIKQILREQIHDRFDHRLILWDQDPLLEDATFFDALDRACIVAGLVQVPVIPTSEGLARYWGRCVAPYLDAHCVRLVALRVWETPNSVATWTREE